MAKWEIPAGNYSGITSLGDGRYAVVCDKSIDGFYIFHIVQDHRSGQVRKIENQGYVTSGLSICRDAEGVAFNPLDSTLWISGEADQQILSYRLDGKLTGDELEIPASYGLKNIYPNYGYESLCYDVSRNMFWTMTENRTRMEGEAVGPNNLTSKTIRLQGYTTDGKQVVDYLYPLSVPLSDRLESQYAYGVSALHCVDKDRLWSLEREMNVRRKRLRSRTRINIYEVSLNGMSDGQELQKKKLLHFDTKMRLVRPKFANYEGMCEGMILPDGRRTFLLISDSQGQYGKRLCHLHDWIRVIVYEE
jgi:hypothetical protein